MRDFEQPPFSIEVAERAGRTVLNLTGELDLATVGELEDAISGRLDAGEDLVVDLRHLEFMDSSGVRALVAGHAAAREGSGSLVIVRAPRGTEVDRVIDISGIATALGMVDEPPQG
jgi:stage II sporulation protein AA (anti-sigma F factor antagonist)